MSGVLDDIVLPSFGSSVGEATLVHWLVAPGDTVTAGQVIAELETDKAMAELEAPAAGVIDAILVQAGSEGVETGTVLARLRRPGAASPSPVTAVAATTAGTPAAAPPPVTAATAVSRGGGAQERTLASPYARTLAAERGVELAGIAGSGPGGRVVSRDLPAAGSAPGDSPAADGQVLEPVSRMRRAIAEGLTRSVREIPHFSLVAELSFEAVLAHRAASKAAAAPGGAVPSLNDYVVRACALALVDVPQANRSWLPGGIAVHPHADIAVAVAVADGLVAPVVRAVETLTLAALAAATRDAIRRAQGQALKTAELQGATFTVSNLGMLGVRAFNSILSGPQACILSVGAVEPRPVVRGGQLAIEHQASLTLTCDHRVVDGAVGARFLQALAARLAEPSA